MPNERNHFKNAKRYNKNSLKIMRSHKLINEMNIVILNNNVNNLRIETNENGRRRVTICPKKRLIKFKN